ncbi:class I SAM-dependent methyltransferase [Staphylococcus chromogenes]|nr:class I SAM-dependent methyltransferase [Staphylococcus chromogenes]
MAQLVPAHLSAIDAELWPAVAYCTAPGPLIDARARRAEAQFAAACERAGITLAGNDPDLVVLHDELFVRIAEHGWVGVAEGFMAGEWESDRLVSVLSGLLASGYRPKSTALKMRLSNRRLDTGTELPPELVSLYAGDGVSNFGGIFASGVPTTQRVSKPSFVRGAGRRNEPKSHFVDVTEIAAPGPVERADVEDSQRRTCTMLLDLVQAHPGLDLLEFPSSGGALAFLATHAGATVDVLSVDADHLAAVEEYLTINGAASMARTHLLSRPIPHREDWEGRYDAIVSIEKFETMTDHGRLLCARAFDRMLGPDGFLGLQTVVATPSFSTAARDAIEVLREYVWPGLRYQGVDDLHKLFDRETGLRITAEIHFGAHYRETLRLQRELFEGKLREAAAAGFDPVFRRLWIFRFALLEAMFRLGFLDAVQLRLTGRSRGGRR